MAVSGLSAQKTKRPVSWKGAQNLDGRIGQRHDMKPAALVLVCGQGPGPGFEIEVRPAHPAHFVSTLTKQRQKLRSRSVGRPDFLGGVPNGQEFIIRQNAIAAHLLDWLPHIVGGRCLDKPTLDAPAEKPLRMGEQSVGADPDPAVAYTDRAYG